MDNPSLGLANFCTQTDALLGKNLAYQKRNKKANCRLISFPFFLCVLLAVINYYARKYFKGKGLNLEPFPPGYVCPAIDMDRDTRCNIPSPPENPKMLQIPLPNDRATRNPLTPFEDLPDESCKKTNSCPATILLTGNNKTLGLDLGGRFFPRSSIFKSPGVVNTLPNGVFGTVSKPAQTMFVDPALLVPFPIYILQPTCSPSDVVLIPTGKRTAMLIQCLQGLNLWRNRSNEINDELFKGYWNGNSEKRTNEIVAAYDFLNSSNKNFNVNIWYNSTMSDPADNGEFVVARVSRLVNLASNAYLEFLRGPGVKILFDFVKEMPKHPTISGGFDISYIVSTLFFTWVILQLYPVMLTSLVYEKQENLRVMMKMHGLGDGPYWTIYYIYFLVISLAYMLCFVLSCSILDIEFFEANDYSLQFVFYCVYLNLQIAFSFLAAGIFSKVKTASVIAYAMVFGTGLLGSFYFGKKVDDPTFSRGWIAVMELYPGLALYRMLYEFSEYALQGSDMNAGGMKWKDMNDSTNGMKELLIIMIVEWFVLLFVAYYIDQVISSGSGVRKSPLFLLRKFQGQPSSSGKTSLISDGSRDFDQAEKADVAREREKVEQLLIEPDPNYAIVCDDLKKVYPAVDGNPPKLAVRGLSLALPRGECFGMLGPNGAGKTSFIKMIGLTEPSSGTAYVQGLDMSTDMDKIYTSMGVCPQHDLLWETLTAREHLLFYGRLKNLRGSALNQVMEESLKGVNLHSGGVADKEAGKYSGGMKRRLSVAISLIGDPKVVYMDEPSTGLDPASRNELWNVVMKAKRDRAILLTTHSMEEVEHLCDRLGIFVDGSLQCIGNAKQLKARYGGSYGFTITTPSNYEQEVDSMVRRLFPSANKTYHISGTQKFELPKHEVRIADVFQAVDDAKNRFTVQAWGLVDTTLEDVFIKVSRGV